MSANQNLQQLQYKFPYHHLVESDSDGFLMKYWHFAPSYVAAVNLIKKEIASRYPTCQAKILDFGCGDGAMLNHLTENSQELITGIDIDRRSLSWAKMFFPSGKFHSSLDDLGQEQFDLCMSIEVFEHIDPDILPAVISDLSQIIKTGGYLIGTVPSVVAPIAAKHFQHFEVSQLHELLSLDFNVKSIQSFSATSVLTRTFERLRRNRYFRLDCPSINRYLISSYEKISDYTAGERLFFVCEKS